MGKLSTRGKGSVMDGRKCPRNSTLATVRHILCLTQCGQDLYTSLKERNDIHDTTQSAENTTIGHVLFTKVPNSDIEVVQPTARMLNLVMFLPARIEFLSRTPCTRSWPIFTDVPGTCRYRLARWIGLQSSKVPPVNGAHLDCCGSVIIVCSHAMFPVPLSRFISALLATMFLFSLES